MVLSRPRKKGFTWLSWFIILGLVGLLVARSNWSEPPGEDARQDRLEGMVFELQARYLVGAANASPLKPEEFYREALALNRGSREQRLKFVVLAGELAGPQEALKKALKLHEWLVAHELLMARGWLKAKGTAPEQRLCRILIDLYGDYSAGAFQAPSLTERDRAWLRQEFGWFGELALHPQVEPPAALAAPAGAAAELVLEQQAHADPGREQVLQAAYATFWALLVVVIGVCFLSFVGFVGLVIFLILLSKGLLRGGVRTGSSYGGVYAETFAFFLVAFIALSIILQALPMEVPLLLRASVVTLGSLAVVVWPVLRGIPWAQVRQDIGWTLGRTPALEPILGPTCYVMALPIVLVGVGLTLVLIALRKHLETVGLASLAEQQPIHPIVEFIVNGSTLDRILVFVDACILAPIVEETMFRGVLYRHLRELSQRWPWLLSVVVSGTLVSFLFAAIHPQGLVAVPALMALSYGFVIAREWRGTLIPSMIGHALNNCLVVLFVLLMMGK